MNHGNQLPGLINQFPALFMTRPQGTRNTGLPVAGWTGCRADELPSKRSAEFADFSEKMRTHEADGAHRYSLNFIFHRKSPSVPAADACLRIVNKTYITSLSLVINIHKDYIRNVNQKNI